MTNQEQHRTRLFLNNSTYQKFLKKYPAAELDDKILSQLFLKLLTDHLDGKTTSNNTDQTIDKKIKQVKLESAKVKLGANKVELWLKLKVRGGTLEDYNGLVDSGVIPNYENNPENNYVENTTTPVVKDRPQLQDNTFGKTITNKPKKILQDGTLRCLHCNKRIEMRAFICDQLDDYKKHVDTNHGKMSQPEIDEIMEIYPK